MRPVYEVFERMAYYGISSNLVIYLTTKLHQGTVTSSNNVTNWAGTVWMMPVLGAYVADAHLGRYWTFVIACCIYLSGMCLLTLAVSLDSLKPPPCANNADCKSASTLQLGVFFCALYILAIGTGGTKPNILTIGADQFDDFEPKERAHKLSFNWWMFSIFLGTFFANTVLVFLNKVAVRTGLNSPWMLCPVAQVEETKQMLRMLPILVVTFIPSTMIAQVNTLFVKQGKTLNRSLGSHFQIPAASFAAFVTIFMLTSIVIYDRWFVPMMRRWTKNPRGIIPL
ncbi:hypothetical protein MRB53_015858 [Persea americana]|uniref:Uncharacterized protein n=1 Tax=Persea americana TaxID=3435 RepID=A0ACC2M1H9_PERAE|nr:hypothetical protein MRB53_015858 [Persea americana]